MAFRELLRKFTGPPSRPKSDRFVGMCRAFEQRLERWPVKREKQESGKHVAVLVTPWVSTAVPLFSLECGLMLLRNGFYVTALCDFTDLIGNGATPEQCTALEDVLMKLPPGFAASHVESEEDVEPNAADEQLAAHLLHQNAIWKMRGEQQAEQFLAEQPHAEKALATHTAAIRKLLREGQFDWVLIPGGIYGLSGIYVEIARELGVSFTTYDSGTGLLRFSHDCVTTHLEDIPLAVQEAEKRQQQHPGERERVLKFAQEELAKRTSAKDDLGYQLSAASGAATRPYDILVPLNVRWDAAALSRQKLFPSVDAWLAALLEWVERHPSASICIRQHPVERRENIRSSDSYAGVLERFRHLGDRLRFVDAAEEVSTYDILRQAKAVLPHTSTVGVEAAMLAKPVLLSACCYYEPFGFSEVPASAEEYFRLLDEALAGRLKVTQEQQERAAIVYYVTQRCSLLWTVFTPDPSDFDQWVQVAPADLWSRPELVDVEEALLTRQPLPFLRYQRLIDAA